MHAARFSSLEGRFEHMEGRVSSVESGLKVNTELTQQVYDNTRAIVEALEWVDEAKKRAAKRIKAAAWVSKWIIIPTAGAITATWAAAEQMAKFDLGKWVASLWR